MAANFENRFDRQIQFFFKFGWWLIFFSMSVEIFTLLFKVFSDPVPFPNLDSDEQIHLAQASNLTHLGIML